MLPLTHPRTPLWIVPVTRLQTPRPVLLGQRLPAAALLRRSWEGRGCHRMLRTPRPSVLSHLRRRPPRRLGLRCAGPGTAGASSWVQPGWRCWRARSRPVGGPMSCSAVTAVTVPAAALSRTPATGRACPVAARADPAGKEVPEARVVLVDRCPVAAPAVRTARAVREEDPEVPAGPRPTAMRPVAPAQARAASREARAPRVSSSSRTPPRARRAEGAATGSTTFSSGATAAALPLTILLRTAGSATIAGTSRTAHRDGARREYLDG